MQCNTMQKNKIFFTKKENKNRFYFYYSNNKIYIFIIK